jgi:DNA-binding response OmpR family regulator
MDPASERLAGIAFGRFQVLPDRREVLADGRPIKLGGRAFDVLIALIEARGAVVGKDALIARVWPGRIIEENSLAAQIVDLRAAFGSEACEVEYIRLDLHDSGCVLSASAIGKVEQQHWLDPAVPHRPAERTRAHRD